MQAEKDGLDKQFEDYAWSQMNTLLDQELPVQEEKKRRWLLWLFLFLGLSMSGAIVYQVFGGEKQMNVEIEEPIAESEDNEQLTVNSEQLTVNNEQFKARSQKSGDEILESIAKDKDELLTNNQQNISSLIESKTSNLLEKTKINSDKLEKTQTTVSSLPSPLSRQKNSNVVSNSVAPTPKSVTPELPNIETVPDLETSDQYPDSYWDRLTNQQLFPVHPMNISPIEPIVSATRSSIAEPIVRKISKWELAARLGGIATLDGNTHLNLGTNVQYHFKHFKSKWSVRSGASWIVKQNNNLFSLDEADLAAEDLEMIDTMGNSTRTMGAEAYNSTSSQSAFQDSIIGINSPKYHFLRIPLGLEYRLNNRLAVFGGVEVLMPLSRKSSGSNLADNVGVFTTMAGSNMDNTNLGNDNVFIRPSWQWHTGAHFRASQRFSFDFSYHHILPQQKGRNHLRQYFELGLRYNIFSP